MTFFSRTFDSLQHGLDYAALNNKTIANNIANVDTANYKAREVEFKAVLDDKLNKGFETKRSHEKHYDFNDKTTAFKVRTNQTTAYNHNGNNVDVDKEMSNLATNQIYYNALIDRMNGQFNSLQSVIRGGS
ncbi:flagellar basal body rod protein FlgB [Halolactibacillus alkaliphilus]|uniref:Flagellar basal body rod protein FlgB n=1 Tax=Halolactibacillus alkaliphilus TaxID=442899 RepID=A0A511WZ84_9BACI|nr:flagellar basal body rod protein FlgB [Halolactibacillus alkaliphilus]GEN55772.1 flagellar basal body rod protein FlgB [Halolactibacillus alkaliphilus]GGN65014.1 flagellar basal body rod protein FlgB [Halolactibacillus alkaliphilus]SFO64502.1 flagellar basal-body rod protein FlgB [Halolactibacillus alkaliphilus]